MNSNKLATPISLRQALTLIEEGRCTALELLEACLAQIEAREPEVGAWQHRLDAESCLEHYRNNQSFYENSLLKGLPIGIKDIIDTSNMPTEMGSPIHKGRQPVDDASCVALLRQAGGIIIGKTVTTEFAYFKPGKTANPRDLKRTPGGSSSGSAAAVADGMVPAALGSQTAASVIRPAAYCGTVGYVGTRGEFSLRGIQPLGQSLDSLGLFSRQVEDIELLRAILLRQPEPMTTTDALQPKRILLCRGDAAGEVEPDMAAAIERAATILRTQGVDVIEPDNSEWLGELVQHHGLIMAYEAARNLALESGQPDLLSPALQDLISTGLATPRADYLASLQAVADIRDTLAQRYPDVDAMLAPAAPGVAPEGHERTGAPHMSRPWQAMGLPVVTLPGLTDADNLPLGIQLIGQPHSDDDLLRIARWLEPLLS
ncbi:MAG: amidase [Marinobacterium sp.]